MFSTESTRFSTVYTGLIFNMWRKNFTKSLGLWKVDLPCFWQVFCVIFLCRLTAKYFFCNLPLFFHNFHVDFCWYKPTGCGKVFCCWKFVGRRCLFLTFLSSSRAIKDRPYRVVGFRFIWCGISFVADAVRVISVGTGVPDCPK